MPRRTSRHPVRTTAPASPVTVRSLSDPRPGWTLGAAIELVSQGYTLEQIERLTGWAATVLAAQLQLRDRRRVKPA